MKLVTAQEMAAMDRLAGEQFDIPSLVLMENAGQRVAEVTADILGGVGGRRLAIFCGKGNNGGDGLVAARYLQRMGAEPKVYLLASFQEVKQDPQANLKLASLAGVEVKTLTDPESLESVESEIKEAALCIDAIFGTGFSPPALGIGAAAITLINRLGIPVLSVDIPSGLSSGKGGITGEVISARATVTFGLPKIGQILLPASEKCGKLYLADIGHPAALEEQISLSRHLVTKPEMAATLVPRSPLSHKGHYGHALIVAGSWGFVGAAMLAARGALRSGAGLVTVAIPESQAPPVLDSLPEAMILPLPETSRGAAGRQSVETILSNLPGKKAVAIGPGLSRNPETSQMVRDLIRQVRLPLVLDADGLNALVGQTSSLLENKSEVVITPHPGELGRLLGITAAEVQENRIEFAQEYAKKFGVLVALKGAQTVVATPSGTIHINPTGNAGMATGGMGDVLTGMIVAFLAQGYSTHSSTLLGVFLHGLAGDLVAEERGPWGLLASEVADRVPAAIRSTFSSLEKDASSENRNYSLLFP